MVAWEQPLESLCAVLKTDLALTTVVSRPENEVFVSVEDILAVHVLNERYSVAVPNPLETPVPVDHRACCVNFDVSNGSTKALLSIVNSSDDCVTDESWKRD